MSLGTDALEYRCPWVQKSLGAVALGYSCPAGYSAMKVLKVQMQKRVPSRVFEFAAGPGFGDYCREGHSFSSRIFEFAAGPGFGFCGFKKNGNNVQMKQDDHWSVVLRSVELTRGAPPCNVTKREELDEDTEGAEVERSAVHYHV